MRHIFPYLHPSSLSFLARNRLYGQVCDSFLAFTSERTRFSFSQEYALVRPGWSSLKVKKPLFMSSVRGAKMLAVAVCGRQDNCSCCCCCCSCCCTAASGANRCLVTDCGRSQCPALSEESLTTVDLSWNKDRMIESKE